MFKLAGSHAPGTHVPAAEQLLRSVWCKRLAESLSQVMILNQICRSGVLSATVAFYKCVTLPFDKNRRLILFSLESVDASSCFYVFQKYFSF